MNETFSPSRVSKKLAFWRPRPSMNGTAKPNGVSVSRSETGVENLIQAALEKQREHFQKALEVQRRELQAEFSAAVQERFASFSQPVEALYRTSQETRQELIESAHELREEVFRFASQLNPRMSRLEEESEGLRSSVRRLDSQTEHAVGQFGEHVGELREQLDTTNNSLFALHRSTGERISELAQSHEAKFAALGRSKRAGNPLKRATRYCADRLRAVRAYIQHRTVARIGTSPRTPRV
jgi:chromosome segregation ATPase